MCHCYWYLQQLRKSEAAGTCATRSFVMFEVPNNFTTRAANCAVLSVEWRIKQSRLHLQVALL
jgi:hypothetical protein